MAKGMFALVWGAKEAAVAADLYGDIWTWSQEKACLKARRPRKPGHLDFSRFKLSGAIEKEITHQYPPYLSKFVRVLSFPN